MREIKFRAWDKKNKKMLVDYDIDNPASWPTWNLNNVIEEYDRIDWELMQFTGLKDKNGKEIYEGDIWNGREVKFGQFYTYLENGLGNSYWITGFYIDNDEGISEPVESGGEVIGNIYENPELIKTE